LCGTAKAAPYIIILPQKLNYVNIKTKSNFLGQANWFAPFFGSLQIKHLPL
jgi:hypothetical protein